MSYRPALSAIFRRVWIEMEREENDGCGRGQDDSDFPKCGEDNIRQIRALGADLGGLWGIDRVLMLTKCCDVNKSSRVGLLVETHNAQCRSRVATTACVVCAHRCGVVATQQPVAISPRCHRPTHWQAENTPALAVATTDQHYGEHLNHSL